MRAHEFIVDYLSEALYDTTVQSVIEGSGVVPEVGKQYYVLSLFTTESQLSIKKTLVCVMSEEPVKISRIIDDNVYVKTDHGEEHMYVPVYSDELDDNVSIYFDTFSDMESLVIHIGLKYDGVFDLSIDTLPL